ncbi:hypothetical protein [Paraburkholderia sp. BL10I2N1]|uniref:hypothetical protein n=1 Tax=Paraburkholderia sp. BL10I2N1 TaxID=1938796 RepID=UPI00105BAB8B|nr:hypothetical protein [Paraburkholderia sp. BL10I2N1]TDN61760.1 hypothetical protein B0G77_5253 [Paraburkholderia sp. BL10I2N1]
MKPEPTEKPARKRPSNLVLNLLTVLVGLGVLAAGLAYLILNDTPVFAIPLVVTVPVIAAVAFRNCWD